MTTARTLSISLLDENNDPLEGATIRIELVGYDLDPDGVVFPDERVTLTTDQNGDAQVDLWPNEVGMRGSYYRLYAITSIGRKVMDVVFMMPDKDETLRYILANNCFTEQEAALLLERFAKVFMQWKGQFDLANGLPVNPKHGDTWKATGTGSAQVEGENLVDGSVIVYNGNEGRWGLLMNADAIASLESAVSTIEQNLTDHINADDPHGVLAEHTDQTDNPDPHPQYVGVDHLDPSVVPDPHTQYLSKDHVDQAVNPDPHPQYLDSNHTDQALNPDPHPQYLDSGHTDQAKSPDPHPQYLTPDENRPTVNAGELVSTDHPYTYKLDDEDNLRKHNTTNDVTCIVPHDDNIDFPLGATIPGKQVGSGRVYWNGESMNGTTVQIDYAQGRQHTRAPGSPYLLMKEGPNHWVAWGDLA